MKKISLLGIILALALTVSCGSDVNSGATAEINILKIANIASDTVPELGYLTFEFADADSNDYYGRISGMRNIAGMTADVMEEIVQIVGSHFAGGSSARVCGGEHYQLVDAEKYAGKDNNTVSSGAPYGDANLCWAASTANMLVMTGWNDGMNEDEIMSEFTENYFDEGLFQYSGIKFFFNGINEDQEAADTADKIGAKNAVFVENDSAELMSSTQVRDPGRDDNGNIINVGHHNKYAAECVTECIDAATYGTAELGKIIIDAVDHDNAVGLDVVFYNGDSRVGVHALTVTGYIKSSDDRLVALIIADSDNDIELKKEYADSAKATLAEREARSNTYDMLLTGSFEHQEKEYITLEDYKFSNPKMKYDNAVIQQVAILKSCRDKSAALEQIGTKDAANTPDIILRNGADAGEDTILSTKVGEKFDIPMVVTNRSYKGYSAKDKPVIKGRLIIYRDESRISESPFDIALTTDSYSTGEANCDFSVSLKYAFPQVGEYSVDVEILGVYSGGEKLEEAYTVNNYLKNAVNVTVSRDN